MRVKKSLILAWFLVGFSTLSYGSTCESCSDGQYSDGTKRECSTCPASKYCAGGSINDCPSGSYCPAGSSFPITCPAGNKCLANAASPTPCVAGEICPAGTEVASICPAGSYCPAGAGVPTKCPIGTYQPLASKTSASDCLPCNFNNYNDVVGATSCKPCPGGSFAYKGWSRCSNNWTLVVSRGDPGDANGILPVGQYRIEVSGGTGGRGGGYMCGTTDKSSQVGGKGEKKITYIYLSRGSAPYSLSVGGNGGNGENKRHCKTTCGGGGDDGKVSSVTVDREVVLSSRGGAGSGGCCSTKGGGCDAPSYSGDAAKGEVNIYQLQP